MERYVPRAYDGNLILFRSHERILGAGAEVDPDLGWGGLAKGGISVYEAPSGHLGMLREPHVRFVGKKMRTSMDRALREFHLPSHRRRMNKSESEVLWYAENNMAEELSKIDTVASNRPGA